MSGETEKDVSGWTTDTLKDYVDTRLDAMDLRYQQRFDGQQLGLKDALLAAKEAVSKAETAADKRFESVNEFRQTLSDQANTFLSRTEYSTAHEALEKVVVELANRLNRTEGHSTGLNAAWGILIGVAALVSVAVAVIVATR